MSIFLSDRDGGKYAGIVDSESGEITLVPLKHVRLRPAISITQEVDDEPPEPKMSRQELVRLIQ